MLSVTLRGRKQSKPSNVPSNEMKVDPSKSSSSWFSSLRSLFSLLQQQRDTLIDCNCDRTVWAVPDCYAHNLPASLGTYNLTLYIYIYIKSPQWLWWNSSLLSTTQKDMMGITAVPNVWPRLWVFDSKAECTKVHGTYMVITFSRLHWLFQLVCVTNHAVQYHLTQEFKVY
jgi:hypothetical protein